MDGQSDARVITAIEAAVTELVGAGVAGSICVPSWILPGAPRSKPIWPSFSACGRCIRGDPSITFGGWGKRASELGAGCPPRAPTLC